MNARILLCTLVGLVFSACGAPEAETPAELDVVVTAPIGTFDFTQARTYDLPTTIPVIKTSDTEAAPVEGVLDATLQTAILNTVNQNMRALGYQQLPDDSEETPSVFLEISAMATTQTDVYYSSWYSYWGGYYGSYYGGFSAGWAPYAVPYVTTSQYGSLLLNMTNPNAPDPATQTIPSLWTAVVAGLITGETGLTAQDRITNGINQAFAQSAYLNNGTQQ